MNAIKKAIQAKDVVRALNQLVGCPDGGWPETKQAIRALAEALPALAERRYSVYDVIDAALCLDHADRYRWRIAS